MPHRAIVTRELAALLGVLSHPHRLRIVEELRDGEHDVNALQAALGVSHSGASQHLSVLPAHRLVSERREGRHVFYRLRRPDLARWLLDGVRFLEERPDDADTLRNAIASVREEWAGEPAQGG